MVELSVHDYISLQQKLGRLEAENKEYLDAIEGAKETLLEALKENIQLREEVEFYKKEFTCLDKSLKRYVDKNQELQQKLQLTKRKES